MVPPLSSVTESGARNPDSDAASLAVRGQLLDFAYARARFGLFAMPLVSMILALYYRQSSDDLRVTLWSLGYFLAAALGGAQHNAYKNDKQTLTGDALYKKWLPRIQTTALLQGLGLAVILPLVSQTASIEFKYLCLTTLGAIMAGNAIHQATLLTVFFRFLVAGWLLTVVLMPWSFSSQWEFVMPLCVIFGVGMYRQAVASNRFFVQLLTLKEQSAQLTDSYKRAKEDAENALIEKNLFLATASHDLRQPVHAMAMLVEATAVRNKDKGVAPLLADLKSSTNSLNQMLNALLDLSKLETGLAQPHTVAVNLPMILSEVAGLFREQATAQGLTLRLRLPVPNAAVLADPNLLRQALVNLMHNALRYTQTGGVLLDARRRGDDWQIELWDTGVGIAAEDGDQVFSPFFRTEHAWRVTSAGHGLGLAVVARCAKLMGGTHGLQSRLGQGSRFWLRLAASTEPSKQQSAPPLPGHSTLHLAQALAGRCLVLDDDPQVIEAWTALLDSWEIDGRFATTASEAFAHLDAGFEPAAIFCDQRLRSGESGFDVLRTLLSRCPNASGAMVSGEFNSQELQEAESEGYLILRKPFDLVELHALLCQWLPEPGAAKA